MIDIRHFMQIVNEGLQKTASGQVILYHLTTKPRFKLNPNFEPQDNSISISSREGHKGIYLTSDVEKWVNGHGYWRPFVAEIYADQEALQHDTVGRWGGEIFVPAEQFNKLTVNRVMPIDAYAREKFGEHGWMETMVGKEFDTGKEISRSWNGSPFKDYKYDQDVRNLPPEEAKRLNTHFSNGYKAKKKYG